MRTFRTLVVAALAVLLAGLVAAPASASKDDWRGSRYVRPAAYRWLDRDTPDGDYEVLVVRGRTVAQVRRALGVLDYRMPDMSPVEAEYWVNEHTGDDLDMPPVAQVQRRGPAVFVYSPFIGVPMRTIKGLSRHGTVAYYVTTVEDDYLAVARKGKLIRDFDPMFRPDLSAGQRHLPEEKGLDWGEPHENVPATAWAFMERVTRIHVSKAWFNSDHPTYLYQGTAP